MANRDREGVKQAPGSALLGTAAWAFPPSPGTPGHPRTLHSPAEMQFPLPAALTPIPKPRFNWGQWDAPLARDSLCDFKASRKQLIAGKAIRDRDLRVVRAKGCSQTSCLKIWEWLFGGDLLVQPPRVMSPAATRKRQPGMSHGDEQTHHKYTSGSSLKIWKT